MSRNLLDIAAPAIESAIDEIAFGEDLWWTLTGDMVPLQNGPQLVYLFALHGRSPIIGDCLTAVSVFDNPLDIMRPEVIRQHIVGLVDAVRQNRTAALQQLGTSSG